MMTLLSCKPKRCAIWLNLMRRSAIAAGGRFLNADGVQGLHTLVGLPVVSRRSAA